MTIPSRPSIGTGVFILNTQNQILLGKRLTAHGYGTWSIPGGHLEYGENIEECAIRETLEETGLSITDLTFLGLTENFFPEEHKHSITFFMRVLFPEGQKIQNPEPDKMSDWEWFDLNALPSPLFKPLTSFFAHQGYGILDLHL